ncbi:MAG: hypothetical protein J6V72_03145, partial [Kiritimatiellae bacterium]|nr:hypothetical protein [Kiritimatiellia bacterium]
MKTIGKSCLAVTAWGVLCVCAVSAADKPAAKTIWPSSDVSLDAQQGATIKECGGTVFVQTGRCRPNSFPNVRFVYRETADLSGARAIRATFTNCTDKPLRISLKVKGETAQGRLPEGGCTVPAHSARVYTLPLAMERWVFDKDPNLVGLKRRPHVGGVAACSLSKVKAISAYIFATDNVRYGVSDLELVEDGSPVTPPTVLKADSFYPWVDEFGQANFAEWPDKIHSRDELRARGAAEESEIAANPDGIPDADRFGGWAKGPQLKATGRFRTEKVNGKWWLVDPDGHLFFSQGVNCAWEQAATGVTGRESYFEKLPPREGETRQFWTRVTKPALRNYYDDPAHVPFWAFSFTSYDLWLKYGEGWRIKNAEMSHRRMKSWGINTYTAGSIPGFEKLPRRIPFVAGFSTKSRPIVGVDGYWGKLNDPFAPEFEKNCIESAKRTGAWGTNEWCIGWTVDNERSWGYDGAVLARGVLNSPEDQPARVALMKILAEKGMTTNTVTREVLRQMGEAVAEKYYSTVRAAIKGISPDILYLGDRNDKRNPEVFRAAARNCDVVTVNVYDRIPSVGLPPDAEDKPLLVTEFHFGCYDTGYFYASLVPVKDQKARAESYLKYLRSAVDNPAYVGAHWFCWRDCPITGQRGEGANAQCGLVSITDVPYTELVKAIRTVSREMYQRRAPVAIADAAAPQLDFSVPGSLRVTRGAFQDGAAGQISYSAGGATVKLDAARVKASEPSYYALAPVPACKTDWRDRRVSLFVKFGERPAVRRSLSLDFHDAEGETFRYKPVFTLPQGDVTRLDYLVTEKGVSLKTWGKKVNGRFDGAVRLGGLLGSYAAGGAGEIVYVRLVASDNVLTRTIDAFVPISDDKTFPGPKPTPTFEEVLKTPSGRVGRLKATAVEALDFDVDTGDPLHLIRGGRGTPTLVFTNLSRGTRRWKGTVGIRDHFGRGFDQVVDVTAAPEGVVRVALERPLPYKGFWRVFAELTGDDGQAGMKEARFAAIDRHEVTPALPKPFFRMGINFHAQRYWNNAHFEKTLDALVASGAKLVRSGGFKFADVAKTPEYDWTMTDALVAAYRARGIAINANVYPGPAWARVPQPDELKGMRHRMNLPTRPGLFRDYCAAIAARYGTKIDYYEMGNEWDLTSDRVLPPDEALRLLREGYAGIKASCPSATVIPCGWAYADSSGQKNMPNPGLIEKFAGTAQDAFDVWALHLHGPFESYAELLQKQFFPMRKRLGLDAKPWYSNETALNTAGDEDEAARAVWQKILYAWAWGATDYIWDNLRATGWNPSAGEDSYGLITPDYYPRATFAAFAALATLV